MAELTCSVNTCASHNGGYCCRNSIKIDGHSAVMKDQTFCGSFPAENRRRCQRSLRQHPQSAHGDPLLRQPLCSQPGRALLG